jgi:glutamate synthase domain-containing protein 3
VPLRLNAASVRATALAALAEGEMARPDAAAREAELRDLVAAHAAEGSSLAAKMVAGWETERTAFWLVEPIVAG